MNEKNISKKKIVVMLLSLLTLTGLLFIAGWANPIIEFEDYRLEEVVREKLDRPMGPIYETDLRTITELDASNKGIESLIGLERFTRLVDLNLEGNNVNSLTPLEDLTMLKILNLQDNGITSLAEVEFQNITHLELRKFSIGNDEEEGISDLTLIGNLVFLEELDLRNNNIDDVSALKKLTILEILDLRNNNISNLEDANFDKIVQLPLKELDLGNNTINGEYLSDIELLRDMRTLKELNVRENRITDLSPLAYLTNLESLNLRDNNIVDLEEVNFNEIMHLPLKELSLRHNVNNGQRLSDIGLLERMTMLEDLELRDNDVDDLTPLSNLTNLKRLDIRENNFTSVEALSGLINLIELNLRENDINSIEPLSQLVNLEYLNIHSNDQIDTLSPITNLTKLETLIMRSVPIRSESFIFEHLLSLQNLNALDTGIEEADTIETFSNIRAQGGLKGEVRPITLLHTIDAPVFSYSGGFYEEEIELQIESQVESGTIYYTLDGSEPTTDSEQYTHGDIIFLELQSEDEPMIIRAKMITNDNNISETITQTYFVSEGISDRYNLPVISLSTDKDNFFNDEVGIYTDENAFERGSDWERPIHIEFFEENGLPMIQQNGGVRIHGGWTRRLEQKTLRLYADSEYDTKDTFDYDVFENSESLTSKDTVDEFERLLLRNSGNDWESTMFRDAMLQSLVEPLGTMDTQAYRPSVVFINGEYWGIHNLRERYDEYYLEYTYNIPKEEVVILETNGRLDKGEEGQTHYREMVDYISEHGVEENENYEYIQTMMDTENFKDYVIAQTYFGNTDWPHNNIRFWRSITIDNASEEPNYHDGRWRWMLFDTDFGFGLNSSDEDRHGGREDYTHNTIHWVLTELDGRHGTRTWPNFLIRSMIGNDIFRTEFLIRYADLLNSYFRTEEVIAQIDSMQSKIEPEMSRHIDQWSGIQSLESWYNNVDAMRTFAIERPDYIRQHLIDEFKLTGTINLYVDATLAQNQGNIQVNTLEINNELLSNGNSSSWSGEYFQDIPLTLTAIANPGYIFSHWEGIEGNPSTETIEIIPTHDIQIKPVFIKQ